MIKLENGVPQAYVEESRDFQLFIRAYDVLMNMVKQDADTLKYITDTKQCDSKLLPLLKTKLGFFTNYPMNDDMLRGILSGFPLIVKNKGSLLSIQQALNIFLRVLNIKTEIVIKVTDNESETAYGSIVVGDHTLLIAIKSALHNFYILEELFKYIMPIGYQYSFYFYKELVNETWLTNKSTGRFLIVNTLDADSIRSENLYNQGFDHSYTDSYVDKMVNQVGTINLYRPNDDYELYTSDFALIRVDNETAPDAFEYYPYFFYKKITENSVEKYVQLQDVETYEAEKYYIPQFFFVNVEEMTEPGDYVLLTTKPVITYNSNDEYDLFTEKYFNYYYLEDGKYKNLTEPVPFEANTYYEPKSQKVHAIANNLTTYQGVAVSQTYINTLLETINGRVQ